MSCPGMQVKMYMERVECARALFTKMMDRCRGHDKHCCIGTGCMNYRSDSMNIPFSDWPEPSVERIGMTKVLFRYYDGESMVSCSHDMSKQCFMMSYKSKDLYTICSRPLDVVMSKLRAPYVLHQGEKGHDVLTTARLHFKGIAKGIHAMRSNSLAKRVCLHLARKVVKDACNDLYSCCICIFDHDPNSEDQLERTQEQEVIGTAVDDLDLSTICDMGMIAETHFGSRFKPSVRKMYGNRCNCNDKQMNKRISEESPESYLDEDMDLWPDGEEKDEDDYGDI